MSPEVLHSIKVYSQFVHPVLMWVLLGLTLYAGYLGMKIRATRAAEGDTKKELIKGRFNVRHYQYGSIILALMVVGAVGAMAATYVNSGKLFVNPHLLIGLGMTSLIAVSASLSPYMQKGQDWARYTHISINVLITGLFAWQAVTGVGIVQNIISRM